MKINLSVRLEKPLNHLLTQCSARVWHLLHRSKEIPAGYIALMVTFMMLIVVGAPSVPTDEVLRRVAQCLKDFTRYHDVAARVGGEEFAVVAPNMDKELLGKLAERIRKAVADLTIESGNVRLKVTSSFGLAIWDGRETAEAFYKRADTMLYAAKQQGRNRVCA